MLIPSTDTERITKIIDNQENPFIKPKHTIKKNATSKDRDVNNVLLTQNRYSSLWEENIDKNTDESDDVTHVHTENINDQDVVNVNTKEAVKSRFEANKEVLQNQSQTTNNNPNSKVRREKNNILILSDSVPKGIRMREFNNCLTGGNAHLKSFPGATAKRLNRYPLPTLTEDQPDTVIVHVGGNDLSLKSFENQDSINTGKVCQDVIDIGKTCINHGVSKVFISSITVNRNRRKNLLIDEVNVKLKEKCEI